MDRFPHPDQRCSPEELGALIEMVSRNPVTDGLLKFTSGLLAILDEHRQIIAINDSFLEFLGLEHASVVIGLRPGEAIHCIHADGGSDGCGTSKACETCGAAIAIVTALSNNIPSEQICTAAVKREGQIIDLCFQVRCVPVSFQECRFLLLYLQDITSQQKWISMERVFFHDVMNIVNGLVGAADLMSLDGCDPELSELVNELALQLKSEIGMQRILAHAKSQRYEPAYHEVTAAQVVRGIKNVFSRHPEAQDKTLNIIEPIPDLSFTTDYGLLLRVLVNMLTNAFEATDLGGEVRFRMDVPDRIIAFYVWNERAIPENIKPRIFQRNFTTKSDPGHGIGTYSMKLFGENFLKGKVDFTSSEGNGTLFSLTLPSSSH